MVKKKKSQNSAEAVRAEVRPRPKPPRAAVCALCALPARRGAFPGTFFRTHLCETITDVAYVLPSPAKPLFKHIALKQSIYWSLMC